MLLKALKVGDFPMAGGWQGRLTQGWAACMLALSFHRSAMSAASGEVKLAGCSRSTLLLFVVLLLKPCVGGFQAAPLGLSVWSPGLS